MDNKIMDFFVEILIFEFLFFTKGNFFPIHFSDLTAQFFA